MVTLDAPRGVRKELAIRAATNLENLVPGRHAMRLSIIGSPRRVRIGNIRRLGGLPQTKVPLVIAPLVQRSSLLNGQRRIRSEQGAEKSNTPKRLAQATLPKGDVSTLTVSPSRTIAPETPDADERKSEDEGRHLDDEQLQN